jgi:hypothetical protein
MERPRLIDTFKKTFSEVRAAFPDVQVTVEDGQLQAGVSLDRGAA